MITDLYGISIFKGQGIKYATGVYGVVHLIPQKAEFFIEGIERKIKMVPDLDNLTVGFAHGVVSGVKASDCYPAAMPFDELQQLREKHGYSESEDEG